MLRAAPDGPASTAQNVLLLDANRLAKSGAREQRSEWGPLTDFVLSAVSQFDVPEGELPDGAVRVPLLDLLDDEVDATPGRHISAGSAPSGVELAASWAELTGRLNAHFLAGCLRAPSNGRQAGTHASSSSRVDIRRLHVLQLPLEEQAGYAEVFRRLTSFRHLLRGADVLGEQLADDISDRLAAGGLTAGR
ncbi:hypothetical protein [Streptomyces atroolivaceus]|uniref:hypothetical protein n=1 Tax=Streptomyces atroolivaceus TaxID=66869 RepID=UPI003429A47E